MSSFDTRRPLSARGIAFRLAFAALAAMPWAGAASLPAMFARTADGGMEGWAGGLSARFAPGRVEFRVGGERFALVFAGANPSGAVEGEGGGARLNFLSGENAGAARSFPVYDAVRYRGAYPGVDVAVRGEGSSMKPEYIVAPGADPRSIRFFYEGGVASVDAAGGIQLSVGGQGLREDAPVAYQMTPRGRSSVSVAFEQDARGVFGFRVGEYDQSEPLVIDPALNYSALINGTSMSSATGVVSDAHGNVYLCGWTDSGNFPLVAELQPTFGGGNDVWVAKLAQPGRSLVWATYLGGMGDDRAFGIALDAAGEVVVTGWTQSVNFPVASAYQSSLRADSGQDAFVAKINAAGNALVFSTYLGGSGWDTASAVALDSQGNVYIAGDTQSHDFPVLAPLQALNQGQQNAFVAEFSATGSLEWATYLGGNSLDHAAGVAVDTGGNVYVAGSTWSTAFPVKNAYQATNHGGQDAFVAKIAAGGGSLVFSTYLGGSGSANSPVEGAVGVGVDASGDVYVGGTTNSMDFPVAQPLQGAHAYGTDLFLTEFNPQGSALLYSTYLGGSSYDYAHAFLLDAGGNAYIAGQTLSTDLPMVNPYQAAPAGMLDGFVIKMNPTGTAMTTATYLGGALNDVVNALGVDHWGDLYLAGQTASSNFPGAVLLGGATGLVNAFVSSIAGPGDHTAFLDRLYQGFFNRAPDPSGEAYWAGTIDEGQSELQITYNFYIANETYSKDFAILEAYFAILNIDPAYTDFANWLTQFDQSSYTVGTQLNLINALMSTPSFQTSFGSLTNSQFVSALYQQMYGQAPSATTLAQLTAELNAEMPRSQLIQAMITDPNYVSLITIRAQVDIAYLSLLLRSPDPSGQAYWEADLQHGFPLTALVASFVLSTEFQNGL